MFAKNKFVITLSAIPSLAIFLLIKTVAIKVTYSIFAFMLTFLFLLLISDLKITIRFKIKGCRKADLFKIVYLAGFLASTCILIIPSNNLTIYGNSIIASFTDPLVIARLISGYFLISIFPGIFIYNILLEGKINLDTFEKVGFILAFSYCYTLLVGGLLLFFKRFSPMTFVTAVWVSVTMITLWLRYKNELEEKEDYNMQHRYKLNLNSIMLFTTLMWWILFAYQTTLFVCPMSGYMGWDPPENIAGANEAVNFGPFVRGLYTGNHFWWILGSITGVPMHYAFAAYQFMTVLPVLSFYTLVRALFPYREKIAVISTFLVCFLTGMTSLYMFFSTETLGMYLSGGTINALKDYWVMIRGPDSLPAKVSPYCFDVSLVLLSLSLSYRYLTSSRKYSRFWIISALFVAIAFTVHSLNYLPTFFGTMIFFLLLRRGGLTFLLKFMAVFLFFIFSLDPIFGWFLTTQIFIRAQDIRLLVFLPLLIGILMLLFIVRRKIISYPSPELRQFTTLIEKNKVSFWVLGLSIFVFAVILYHENFHNLSYSSIQSNNSIAPWYFYIVKYFGITLPLSIGSIPLLIRMTKKDSLFFIVSWFIGSLVIIPFIWVFPQDLPPYLFFTRSIRHLSFPVSVIAALPLLFIFHKAFSLSKNERRKSCQRSTEVTRKILCTVLVVLLILPYTSRALLEEFLYVNGQQQAIPEEAVECINWINRNLSRNLTILPLSVNSYNLLTNLAYERPILPIFFKFSSSWLAYSWLRDILLESSRPEAILYILHKVGVNYIFASENDISNLKKEFSNSSFLNMLNFFPIAYESQDGKYKVFAVPKYPLYEDSNYVLVYPTLNNGSSVFNRAFNIVLHFGINFSVIDSLDLKELKKDYVYIFPGNLSYTDLSNFLADVSNGSHIIVILDSSKYLFTVLSSWHFNEGAGNVTLDSVNGVYGIVHNAIWVDGKFGKALRFDGLNSYVLLPQDCFSTSQFQYGGAISFWFKAGTQSKNSTIISIEGAWFIYLRADGRLSFDIDGSPGSPSTRTSRRYDDNEWHHVVAMWNGSSNTDVVLYIDGIQDGMSQQDLFDIDTLNRTSTIGSQYGGLGLYFNGTIDEVEIYRRKMQYNASRVVFKDGYSVYLDREVSVLNFSSTENAEVLASYEIDGNLTIPFIVHKRIGNGTMTFLNMPLQGFSSLNSADLIQHIFNILKAKLPMPKPCNAPLSLPYSQDILKYVKPHILSLRFTEDLHRTLLYYGGLVVNGEIRLNSNFLYVPYLPIRNMTIRADEITQRFEETTIYNFSIKGDIKLYFFNSVIKIQNIGSGLRINAFLENCTRYKIVVGNAELRFYVEGQDPSQKYVYQNVNITIEPINIFTLIIEQPSMQVKGSISGIMQGAMLYNGSFYYTPSKGSRCISGEFTLWILYDSGIIYAKIMKITHLISLIGNWES